MLARVLRACTVLAGVFLGGSRLNAADNDIRLARGGVLVQNVEGVYVADAVAYSKLMSELSYVLGPRAPMVARTIGHSQFGFGLSWSGSSVSSNESYYKTTEAGARGAPNPWLHRLDLAIQKGLPLSLEVTAGMGFLLESEIVVPSLQLKFEPIEGYKNLPDFAVSGGVSHALGTREFLLTIVNVDAVISKRFSVDGNAQITPMFGWTILLPYAQSRVVDPTPADASDLSNNVVFPSLTPSNLIGHALNVGAQFQAGVISLGVRGSFSLLGPTDRFGSVKTITTEIKFQI